MDWKSIFSPGDRIVAAVSGGGDSMLCALTLADEASRLGITLSMAHVNHHMTEVADADEQRVRDLAAKLGVECEVLHLHDDNLRESEGASTSIEARLRDERLRLLKAAARRIGARAVALGHTATDRAETFLLMALRGSGPRGLGSMVPVLEVEPGMYIIRPLLHLERDEVIGQLSARGLEWSDDPLNSSTRFRRNRVRKEVFPILRAIEPAAARVIVRSAELCYEQAELLDTLTKRELASIERQRTAEFTLMDRNALRTHTEPMVRALLRVAWKSLLPPESTEGARALPPPGVLIETLARAVINERTDEAHIGPGKGVLALVRRNDVLLYRQSLGLPCALSLILKGRSRVIILPEDFRQHHREAGIPMINSSQRFTPAEFSVPLPHDLGTMHFRIVEKADFDLPFDAPEFLDNTAAAFDVRTIRKDLYLRPAVLSDKIPLGKGASKTVGDVLKEAGIPPELRPRVATLCDERGVLWIPGVRRPATGYVTERTQMVLTARMTNEG